MIVAPADPTSNLLLATLSKGALAVLPANFGAGTGRLAIGVDLLRTMFVANVGSLVTVFTAPSTFVRGGRERLFGNVAVFDDE